MMIIIKFRINRTQVVSPIGLINLEINNLLIMLKNNIINKLFIAHSCSWREDAACLIDFLLSITFVKISYEKIKTSVQKVIGAYLTVSLKIIFNLFKKQSNKYIHIQFIYPYIIHISIYNSYIHTV